MKVWVVEMLRWGDRENHSYVIGVYGSKYQAELAGKDEREWRGGKYEPELKEFEIDAYPKKYGEGK